MTSEKKTLERMNWREIAFQKEIKGAREIDDSGW